jgi:hypothetical protein
MYELIYKTGYAMYTEARGTKTLCYGVRKRLRASKNYQLGCFIIRPVKTCLA